MAVEVIGGQFRNPAPLGDPLGKRVPERFDGSKRKEIGRGRNGEVVTVKQDRPVQGSDVWPGVVKDDVRIHLPRKLIHDNA